MLCHAKKRAGGELDMLSSGLLYISDYCTLLMSAVMP